MFLNPPISNPKTFSFFFFSSSSIMIMISPQPQFTAGCTISASHRIPIDSAEIHSQPENKVVKLPVTCFLEEPGPDLWGIE